MANIFGRVTVKITWQYIQVWRSIMSREYRLQDGVEPEDFKIEDLQACKTAHQMLNFMGAMGWENYQVLPAPDGNVFNYFFKRPILVEEGQAGPAPADSVTKNFELLSLMAGD